MQLKDSESDKTTYEQLEDALVPSVSAYCEIVPSAVFPWANACVIALIFTLLVASLVKCCHAQFSHSPINKLSLRPLMWA